MKHDQGQDQVAWKGEWQTLVPDRLFDADISGMAKLLWISLKRYVGKNSPNPFPGRYTLCRTMKCGVSAFKTYRRELEQSGWLETYKRRGDRGLFYGNIYTLAVPDNCKQIVPPGVEKRSAVQPPVAYPPVDNQPPKEPQSEGKPVKRKTNTNEAAGAASSTGGEGDLAAGAASADVGSCFLKRWSHGYQQWFKTPYLQKQGEAIQARKIIKELECRPKDLLAYAFRMWVNTTDYDEVDPKGYDPMFYQIKGSRSVRFFLSHLTDIANEQKKPFDCGIPVMEKEYRELEAMIAVGRPDPC